MRKGRIEYTKDYKTKDIIYPVSLTDAILNSEDISVTQLFINEETARTEKDTELQKQIDDLSQSSDTQVDELTKALEAEAQSRTEADNILRVAINTETADRVEVINDLQTQVNSEATIRETNDNTLQSNIDKEAAMRLNKDDELEATKVSSVKLNGTDVPKDIFQTVNIDIPTATYINIREMFL